MQKQQNEAQTSPLADNEFELVFELSEKDILFEKKKVWKNADLYLFKWLCITKVFICF